MLTSKKDYGSLEQKTYLHNKSLNLYIDNEKN